MLRGIIIACDARYAVDLRWLLASLRQACPQYPVAVYGFGWPPDAFRAARAAGVPFREFGLAYQERWRGNYDRISCWQKPWFIREAPFETVLYLDPDVIVLHDPTVLFERAETDGLTVFPQRGNSAVCCCNDPAVYDLAPPAHPPTAATVQAGVIGVCPARERKLLDTWCALTERALADPAFARTFSFGDQGALLWVLHHLGRLDAIAGDLDGLIWNVSANELWERPQVQRRRYRDDETLLDRVRADHPGAGLVHWYGSPKLRDLLDPPGRPSC